MGWTRVHVMVFDKFCLLCEGDSVCSFSFLLNAACLLIQEMGHPVPGPLWDHVVGMGTDRPSWGHGVGRTVGVHS